MQEEATRSLNSLSLGGRGAGNRSSVVDRVKWIEQKHGTGPSAQAAQPRARLRLPKHFINAQADAANPTTDAAVLSPKTQPAGLLGPRDGDSGVARLPLAVTQQKSAAKIPTLARRTEQMPSPVISEASTVAAIDEMFGEAPLVAKVGEEVPVAKAEEVVEVAPVEPREAKAEAPEPLAPLLPAAKAEGAVYVEPKLVEPVPVDIPAEPTPVAAPIVIEPAEDAAEQLPIAEERPTSPAELTHARMPSEALSMTSNRSDMSIISGVTDGSSLTDPDDPVHVTGTMGGAGHHNENNGEAGANSSMQTPAFEGAASHYATLPRSTKFTGSKGPGLGGTRNRPQQAPRRYDRSTTSQRPDSSASMQSRNSEDSGRSSGSVFGRPKVEAPRVHGKEQPLVRSFSTKPSYSRSAQVADDGDFRGRQGESGSSSLLARLNDLSAVRPNAQDLVNNRSSPKFVKRSQYYGPSLQDDVGSTSSGSGPRNRAQRRFR
ncbi:hypothetical protein IWW37_005673 [Coemansia sp. RSA 2050]|nr:hypothetical protein IWW37_005673 [Coemansia sp. RSA 2050]